MYRSKLLFFCLLFLFSCDNEQETSSGEDQNQCTALESATGILLADENGALLGDLGPLFELDYTLLLNNNDEARLFPNPCINVLSIIYEGEKVEAVIIPANKLTDCLASDFDVLNTDFDKSDIPSSTQNIELEIGGSGNILYRVDVSSLDQGYYNLLLISANADRIVSRTTFFVNRTFGPVDVLDFLSEGWE